MSKLLFGIGWSLLNKGEYREKPLIGLFTANRHGERDEGDEGGTRMRKIAYILPVFACLVLVGSFMAYAGQGKGARIPVPEGMST